VTVDVSDWGLRAQMKAAPLGDGVPIDIVVVKPTVTLSGTVIDGAGRPLPGATVILRGRFFGGGMSTGRDGSFRLPAWPGDYDLEVAAAGLGGISTTVNGFHLTADRTLTLTLPVVPIDVSVTGTYCLAVHCTQVFI